MAAAQDAATRKLFGTDGVREWRGSSSPPSWRWRWRVPPPPASSSDARARVVIRDTRESGAMSRLRGAARRRGRRGAARRVLPRRLHPCSCGATATTSRSCSRRRTTRTRQRHQFLRRRRTSSTTPRAGDRAADRDAPARSAVGFVRRIDGRSALPGGAAERFPPSTCAACGSCRLRKRGHLQAAPKIFRRSGPTSPDRCGARRPQHHAGCGSRTSITCAPCSTATTRASPSTGRRPACHRPHRRGGRRRRADRSRRHHLGAEGVAVTS